MSKKDDDDLDGSTVRVRPYGYYRIRQHSRVSGRKGQVIDKWHEDHHPPKKSSKPAKKKGKWASNNIQSHKPERIINVKINSHNRNERKK